jgi:pyruvate-formate lyase-activating enzyme
LANFEGSTQQKDIEKSTDLINNFFRIKEDVKVWKDQNFNWQNREAIIQAMADRFDMPSWALYRLKGKKELSEELKNYNDVFIYQLKGCNLHCPYCYVDDKLKNGRYDSSSRFFSIREILKIFYGERERRKLLLKKQSIDERGKIILPLNRIRPSGGEPTLVIEQWLILLRELENDCLDKEVHVQSDTNLTTGHFIEFLEENGKVEKDILKQIAGFRNFSLLASFKGTDLKNYSENTGTPISLAERLLEEAIYSFKKYMDSGIDIYPFFYNPNPETLEEYLLKLNENCGKEIYRKSWVFPLKTYDVTKERLQKEAKRKGIDEKAYVSNCEEIWKSNFEKCEEIMRRINPEYKKILRV